MDKRDFEIIANSLNVVVRKFAVMPADMEVMEQVCQRLEIAFRQHHKRIFDKTEFRHLMFKQ